MINIQPVFFRLKSAVWYKKIPWLGMFARVWNLLPRVHLYLIYFVIKSSRFSDYNARKKILLEGRENRFCKEWKKSCSSSKETQSFAQQRVRCHDYSVCLKTKPVTTNSFRDHHFFLTRLVAWVGCNDYSLIKTRLVTTYQMVLLLSIQVTLWNLSLVPKNELHAPWLHDSVVLQGG